MTKQQLKVLIAKLSKQIFLTLHFVEDNSSITFTDDFYLTYKVDNEELIITISNSCGVLRVTGQVIGTSTLEKIRELDVQLVKVLRG